MKSNLGRRERKKEATRGALQATAFRLFQEQGYDATTVHDISDGAEVSARTFFRYFATKDDVLFGDHELRLAAMGALLNERPLPEPILTSIEAVLSALASDLAANPERALLQARVAVENTHVLGALRKQHAELVDAIAEFVSSRMTMPDPHQIRARVIAAASMGTVLAASRSWVINGCTDDLQVLMVEALDTLNHVLAPEPA